MTLSTKMLEYRMIIFWKSESQMRLEFLDPFTVRIW